jgi:hypothetical protein
VAAGLRTPPATHDPGCGDARARGQVGGHSAMAVPSSASWSRLSRSPPGTTWWWWRRRSTSTAQGAARTRRARHPRCTAARRAGRPAAAAVRCRVACRARSGPAAPRRREVPPLAVPAPVRAYGCPGTAWSRPYAGRLGCFAADLRPTRVHPDEGVLRDFLTFRAIAAESLGEAAGGTETSREELRELAFPPRPYLHAPPLLHLTPACTRRIDAGRARKVDRTNTPGPVE